MRAAALGNRVVFADRQPSREVVAHEVAHVVQQRPSTDDTPARGVSRPADAAEREAATVATAAAAGRQVQVLQHAPFLIHRDLIDDVLKIMAQVQHVANQARVAAIIARGLALTPDPAKGHLRPRQPAAQLVRVAAGEQLLGARSLAHP